MSVNFFTELKVIPFPNDSASCIEKSHPHEWISNIAKNRLKNFGLQQLVKITTLVA